MLEKIKQKSIDLYERAALWFGVHPEIMAIALALSITFANEILSRRSLIQAVVFMLTRPHIFLCNVMIILVFEAFALLFKKRSYVMWFFSIMFLILGVTNFIVRCFRQTPFSSMDFVLVKSVFPILVVYLSWFGIIFIGALIIAAVTALIILWKKAKKEDVDTKRSLIMLLSSALTAVVLIGSCYLLPVFPKRFSNLADAYRDYGFTFCFTAGILDRGIDKPDDYDDKIQSVVSDILPNDSGEPSTDFNQPSEMPKDTPNIIFVQLESFYDMSLLQGFSFSENPTPVFSELKKNCQSGTLRVPSIGAGTANTEFEVLSGMSLKWFGAGEYPYETILQKSTCETICYNLSGYGYTTHAVHNYKGNFYDRASVFKNLGFNTFTPIEHMNDIKTNQLGWAEDRVLTEYVMSSLESTEGPDFVYCITVQAHGKYPTDELKTEFPIKVNSLPEEVNENSFYYYANQLRETDEFIGALISAVKQTGENTKIVFFGDHIPNIGITEEHLSGGMTLYDTEYVIWDSENQSKPSVKPLTAYQLSAEVMSILGFDNGVLTKLHQDWQGNEKYEQYLEMVEYDILYGGKFVYNGENPFKPTDIKLGIRDITVSGISVIGKNTYISGENFTESSRVFVNGFSKQTDFLDEKTLVISGDRLDGNDVIKIVQISDGIFHVGESDEYEVKKLNNNLKKDDKQ